MRRGVQLKSSRQKGLALLVFVVILALAAITFILREMSISDIKYAQNISTSKTLAHAKQALLAYAVTYIDNKPGELGFLPCPDASAISGNEGDSDGSCGPKNANSLGMFPWGTLETGVMKSTSGDCLWYAVSGNYKNVNASTKTDMLNEDTNGWFQIHDPGGALIQGAQPEDRVVAVIIDPSRALSGQNRVFDDSSFCGLNDDPAQFLEGNGAIDNASIAGTADTVDGFIMAGAGTDELAIPFNDRITTITRDELWQAVQARNTFNNMMANLTEALAVCLRDYAEANTLDRLPWPAPAALPDYRISANYNDNADATPGYAGRYPFIVDNSNSDIPGANVSSELFTEAGCSALATSGGAVDLVTVDSEYRMLWENWKDHFFYVVSKDYAPGTGAASCGASCITVNSQRAAMVVYAGSRQGAQVRNGPVGTDADTKFNVANYMENGNEAVFPDTTGNGTYSTAGGTNDVMFCLTTSSPPEVVAC